MQPSESATSIATAIRLGLRRYWRWLCVFLALLAAYALLGFALVPRLILSQAPSFVREHLQRQLSLGRVQFNPFTFTLRISDAQLTQLDGQAIGGLAHLLVNAELSSLLTGSYTFKKIQLDAPTLAVIIDADGRLNLDFSGASAPTGSPAKTSLPAIRIGELQLNKGRVHLEDHTRPAVFMADLRPIQFTLREFRTEPRHDNAFHFSGRSQAGESIDWRGEFSVAPFGSTGRLQVTNLQAATLQGYLQNTLPLRLLSGALSLQGDYRLTMQEAPQLQLDLPSIAVSDVQVAPLQGDAVPWITLPKLAILRTRLSLQDRHVQIGQITVSDAAITAWLDAQRNLNLLQLKGPDSPPSDQPWSAQVDEVLVQNATVTLEDRGVSPAASFRISPARLQVRHFSTAPATQIEVSSTLRINDQGEFNAAGTVNLDSLATRLKVKLADLTLKDMQPYAAAATDLLISDGQLHAEGDLLYRGNTRDKTPLLKFIGQVEVTNLSTQDSIDNLDFIKWQALQLQNVHYTLGPNALEIAQITARQPYGRLIINADGTTNIQQVLRSKPTAKTDDTASVQKSARRPNDSAPALRMRIAKVLVTDGAANFTDNTVQPTFSTGMQRLNGSVLGLSSANDSRAKIKLDGSVDNYAPVAIFGEANFLAAQTFSDVALNFRNMELTTFNPYSGKFAGYSIAKGKLSTELRYRINQRQLDAQHHIVIDQLEFGAATDSKQAVSLPIKLAVALLKDRNGVIDLNLPVSGSLDDPQFKVGPIIWKVFVGLLTKIVTAPFSALGALFGGDGEQLAYVDFAPGSADLSAVEAEKLGKLAQALLERPQLQLNIPLTAINDADAAVMNQAAYDRAVNALLSNAATATPAQRLATLTRLYQSKFNAAPAFPAASAAKADVTTERIAYLETTLKPQFVISVADRDALTRARADAVQAALLANTGVAPEHVYLTVRGNEVPSPAGVVRMELKLE